jgi:hypothetical protein
VEVTGVDIAKAMEVNVCASVSLSLSLSMLRLYMNL